ncbi:acyl-CoA dehydrogenase family protein [Algihabitans albus]|uniref:acyl-CoA dehydrogenase family protein n=1 Tax=Algihabitans albus TaxID=2164067 RepID=UPI000E5D21D5|nr:acyl-CoA dehydrogenase family protein [Algihabitans albus]
MSQVGRAGIVTGHENSANRSLTETPSQPDTEGLDLWEKDRSLQQLLDLYLPADLYAHLRPHLARLGAMVTTRLDALSHTADRHPPVLHARDRQGRDAARIEKHPAYRELEEIAFGQYGLAAMSHRGGVLGWPDPIPPAAKYALTYLFVQSEFGLCCPISMTDALTRTLRRFGDPALVERALSELTTTDVDALAQGAMFITEQGAGSDVGAGTVTAQTDEAGQWRLHGDKWFCSNPDAAWAMVLARPEGAPSGTRGLGLFLMPRTLSDGSGGEQPNAYRIVRLKDKLGTRSLASGEIRLEGALAYPVGRLDQGFKQMAEMINVSRLSNGVRAAGLMRRALHEARHVAENRAAFGHRLTDMPLMRRQLLKLLVPTEQALSMTLFTADVMARSDDGDSEASIWLRLLTPLIKFRACRDARKVTGDSMEVRGGSGYIEEWISPRLVRDAHLGSIWEGTSNIVALDVLRAIRKQEAHRPVVDGLSQRLAASDTISPDFRATLTQRLAMAAQLAERTGEQASAGEHSARHVASALYNATTAAILALEGAALAKRQGDAKRIVLAKLVVDHRLSSRDPLAPEPMECDQAAWRLLIEQSVCTAVEATDFCAAARSA